MNLKKLTLQNFKISKQGIIIFSVFLIVQTILFIKIGVFTDLEAKKYIIQGEYLYNTGHLSDNKYFFYLPVILLVALCKFLQLSFIYIILFQVSLSAFSLYCFNQLTKRLFNNSVAFWSSIILAIFIPIQMWNFYLYSDSIFISLTVIFTYLIFLNENLSSKKTEFTIFFFLLILISSRPNGVLFVIPLISYFIYRGIQSQNLYKYSFLASITLIVIFYFVINTVLTGGEDMNILLPFIEEHIICFVPLKPAGANVDIIYTGKPFEELFYYLTHNPGHFLKMSILKMESFFNLTRSYYSKSHNTLLFLFMIPTYIFLIPGFYYYLKKKSTYSVYLLSLIILYPLCFTFLCDDWHSRFAMIIMPYLIMLSCFGFFKIKSRLQGKDKS